MRVSIRTRPESRVMRKSASPLLPSLSSFNPHPARKPGDAGAGRSSRRGGLVSIRTRPESRVMQPERRRNIIPNPVSIRTRPESRVMPVAAERPPETDPGFNPHPARKPGDAEKR